MIFIDILKIEYDKAEHKIKQIELKVNTQFEKRKKEEAEERGGEVM